MTETLNDLKLDFALASKFAKLQVSAPLYKDQLKAKIDELKEVKKGLEEQGEYEKIKLKQDFLSRKGPRDTRRNQRERSMRRKENQQEEQKQYRTKSQNRRRQENGRQEHERRPRAQKEEKKEEETAENGVRYRKRRQLKQEAEEDEEAPWTQENNKEKTSKKEKITKKESPLKKSPKQEENKDVEKESEEEEEEKAPATKTDEFETVKPPNKRIQAIIQTKKEEEKNRVLEKGLDVDTFEREYQDVEENTFQVSRRGKRRERD